MSTHQLQNGAHSRARLRRIQKVQFGVWGPDEIRKLSVQQANNTGKPANYGKGARIGCAHASLIFCTCTGWKSGRGV